MIAHAHAEIIATQLNALVEPIRRQILDLLFQSPHLVNQIAEALGKSNVTVSHHLKILRLAGLVEKVKIGHFARYSLDRKKFTKSKTSIRRGVFKLGMIKVVLN